MKKCFLLGLMVALMFTINTTVTTKSAEDVPLPPYGIIANTDSLT